MLGELGWLAMILLPTFLLWGTKWPVVIEYFFVGFTVGSYSSNASNLHEHIGSFVFIHFTCFCYLFRTPVCFVSLSPHPPIAGTCWHLVVLTGTACWFRVFKDRYIISWGYPSPTNSEIINLIIFMKGPPYKPALSTVSGPGIPPINILSFVLSLCIVS